MARAGELISERVWRDPETGCLLWTGYKNTTGYGQIEIEGVIRLAHRLAWTVGRGPVPDGKLVLHKCDVRLCVDLEHLFLGTHRENFEDAVFKGRHSGGFPGWAVKKRRIRKLTDDQVRAIRLATGPQREIAERFGIARSYVSEIRAKVAKPLIPD
jgi:hypothetical protein